MPPQKRQTKDNMEMNMADSDTRGRSHEQHVKAGEQSHKNTPSTQGSHSSQAKSGQPSTSGSSHAGTQGGTHEQHVRAGQLSHKNS